MNSQHRQCVKEFPLVHFSSTPLNLDQEERAHRLISYLRSRNKTPKTFFERISHSPCFRKISNKARKNFQMTAFLQRLLKSWCKLF